MPEYYPRSRSRYIGFCAWCTCFHRRFCSAAAALSCFRASNAASRPSRRKFSSRSASSRPTVDGGSNGAPRFRIVSAIGEPALRGQRRHVVERRGDRRLVAPGLQFAHARRVDEQRPSRQFDELPRRRRVTALAVGIADRTDAQRLGAEETIDQSRLPDAGRIRAARPSERGRRYGASALEVGVLERAHLRHVDERKTSADRFARAFGIGAEIRLVQHDDRHRPGIPHHREIPLEAPRVEILRQRRDQEDHVHVRRDDLLVDRATRGRARHLAAPFQADVNDAPINAHPITDSGKIGGVEGLVTEAAADFGPPLGVAGDAIQTALLLDDARKTKIAAAEARGLMFEKRIPAKAFA